MANTIGGNIKSAALDVTRQLQRAGEAIVRPDTLGTEALGAFKTLRLLDKFAELLPANLQGIAKALLGVGIQNIGQHGDPTAKNAARGYASALAIKSGRVPAEVLDKAANPEQRRALTDAAAAGDLATVKSILRHNRKHGAIGAEQRQVPGAARMPVEKPKVETKQVAAMETRAASAELTELADKLKSAKMSGSTNTIKLEWKDGETLSIGVEPKKNGTGFEVVGMHNGERMDPDDVKAALTAFRDAGLKNGDDMGMFMAGELSRMKTHLGGQDGADKAAIQKADAHHRAMMKRDAHVDLGNGVRYTWNFMNQPGVATRHNADGTETKLKGKQLREVADALEFQLAKDKKANPEMDPRIEDHFRKVIADLRK